jgi:hypothetical protein
VEDETLNGVFRDVEGIIEADTGFARFVLPQIVLMGLLENNAVLIEEVSNIGFVEDYSRWNCSV